MVIKKTEASRESFILAAAELTDSYKFTLEVTPKTYVLNFEGEAPDRSIVTNLLTKYELIGKIDDMTRAGMNMLYLSAFAMSQGEVRRC